MDSPGFKIQFQFKICSTGHKSPTHLEDKKIVHLRHEAPRGQDMLNWK